jgi:hypothetical protein
VGLECVHVGDVGLLTPHDRGILDYAAADALVIVSADSDFGELLAAPERGLDLRSFFSVPPTGLRPTSRQGCWRRTCQWDANPDTAHRSRRLTRRAA